MSTAARKARKKFQRETGRKYQHRVKVPTPVKKRSEYIIARDRKLGDKRNLLEHVRQVFGFARQKGGKR